MNKYLAAILILFNHALWGAPVPLDNIPDINLHGVQLEMSREALLTRYPKTISMNSSKSDDLLFAELSDSGVLTFILKDNQLANVIVAKQISSAREQSRLTKQWLADYQTRFGNPQRIDFARAHGRFIHRVVGAVFDLSSLFPHTKVMIESNDEVMAIIIYRVDMIDAASGFPSFEKLSQMIADYSSPSASASPSPSPPPFKDHVAQFLHKKSSGNLRSRR